MESDVLRLMSCTDPEIKTYNIWWITKEITNKDGQTKQVPIQKRDENGNLIYKNEYGKFLDSDQFWKQKGGKASFAKIQDDYNGFIISKE